MARKNRGTLGAAMLVVGGFIGAGTALLLAPQSGKKTRRQITRRSRKARTRASDLFESGGEAAEAWRNHLLKSLDQGQKNLERQKKKLTQLWS
ncbi:YtxH domain-containing protein [Desulfuromonas sp. TF]|uniref:YtxH domain-containing protein n=1 Tax=Desulfuromonas sp. TF TaxID=1232410 RepID=UPI0003F573CF|nr:YtxH domain-containing protein [Desulfuromonas sp. TF]